MTSSTCTGPYWVSWASPTTVRTSDDGDEPEPVVAAAGTVDSGVGVAASGSAASGVAVAAAGAGAGLPLEVGCPDLAAAPGMIAAVAACWSYPVAALPATAAAVIPSSPARPSRAR